MVSAFLKRLLVFAIERYCNAIPRLSGTWRTLPTVLWLLLLSLKIVVSVEYHFSVVSVLSPSGHGKIIHGKRWRLLSRSDEVETDRKSVEAGEGKVVQSGLTLEP